MKASLLRFIRALPFLLLAPILLALTALSLVAADVAFLISVMVLRVGRRRNPVDTNPQTSAASLVIPNWNGRDLLERFLPSWLASIASHPGSEVIVVDNGSTDGSAAWLSSNYPEV